jgi:hypothetical protein
MRRATCAWTWRSSHVPPSASFTSRESPKGGCWPCETRSAPKTKKHSSPPRKSASICSSATRRLYAHNTQRDTQHDTRDTRREHRINNSAEWLYSDMTKHHWPLFDEVPAPLRCLGGPTPILCAHLVGWTRTDDDWKYHFSLQALTWRVLHEGIALVNVRTSLSPSSVVGCNSSFSILSHDTHTHHRTRTRTRTQNSEFKRGQTTGVCIVADCIDLLPGVKTVKTTLAHHSCSPLALTHMPCVSCRVMCCACRVCVCACVRVCAVS